jgi:glycosyltransferase involved in cell wall biosynthesis
LNVQQVLCRGRWDWQTAEAIRDQLRSLKVDIVHTHGYKADIYGYLASRTLGLPIVSTCHLWTRQSTAVRFYEFLDSLFLRRFNAVVAVSAAIAKSLRQAGIDNSKIRVIDNGIDFQLFSRAHPTLAEKFNKGERLVVGTVGRLVAQKGLEYFLRSAREVLLDFPNTLFAVVGAGPDRANLGKIAEELGIRQNVVFVGHCTDMPGAYASMDVFVLASVDEGMPMAILEALASKRPVVATAVGAVPRLIIPEKTGLLVPPRDVQALTQSISRLLSNSSLRLRLGVSGEALVNQSHSHDTMARRYLQLYEEIVRPVM